jgi:hypothetical protein
MKKPLVMGVIFLFLYISLVPGITSKTSYVDDTTPPRTFIELSGEQVPQTEWYYTPVKISIYAIDDYGMGEIHYLLNGKETVAPGYIAKLTVCANGDNNLEYWGVDAAGNEEIPHNFVKIRIVTYDPFFIVITAPEPGIYLFGNKLRSSNKLFIVGSFTIEADADDELCGIKNVEFYLDDTLVGKTSTPPYSAYCTIKHFGAGEIKAIATNNHNSCMEDTLDIEYYKFFGRGSL